MPIRLVNRRGKPVINEDGEPIMERVLRPKYGMHSFRHAAASLFIEEGFSPKRVQDLMGHSTIQITFDTYGHLFPAPADDQVAMRRLQDHEYTTWADLERAGYCLPAYVRE